MILGWAVGAGMKGSQLTEMSRHGQGMELKISELIEAKWTREAFKDEGCTDSDGVPWISRESG